METDNNEDINKDTFTTSSNVARSASAVADQAKEEAGNALAEVKNQSQAALTEVKNQAGEAVGQLRDKGSELLDKTRGQIKEQAGEKMQTASSALGDFATALQQTGENLRDNGRDSVGDLANVAAERLQRTSDYLQNSDMDALVTDTQNFARTQPTLFLGSAFLIGIAAARFLKSSQPPMNTFGGSDRAHALVGPVGGSSETVTAPRYIAHDYVPGGVAGSGEQPPRDMGTGTTGTTSESI